MTKPIEEKDLFIKQPYRSILFVLILISRPMEPKELLALLMEEPKISRTKLFKWRYEKKLEISQIAEKLNVKPSKVYMWLSQYDPKKIKRELNKKITDKYRGYIQSGCIKVQQQLTDCIATLKTFNYVIKDENKRIKITEKGFSEGKKILFVDTILSSYTEGLSRFNFDRLIDYLKNISFDLKDEEKAFEKSHLNAMKVNLEEIKKRRILKFQKKWNEQIGEFYRKTGSEAIKSALKTKPHYFFQIINMPFYFYEQCDKKEFTKFDFYSSTGAFVLDVISDSLYKAIRLKEETDKIEENDKRIQEYKNKVIDIKSQYDNRLLSREEAEKKFQELIKVGMVLQKETQDMISKVQQDKKKEDGNRKKIENKHFFMPGPILDELSYIDRLVHKGKKYKIKRFAKMWSECFFQENFGFTIVEIKEIIDWCWKKVNIVRDFYHDFDLVAKCERDIDDILMVMGDELPFKPLIFK